MPVLFIVSGSHYMSFPFPVFESSPRNLPAPSPLLYVLLTDRTSRVHLNVLRIETQGYKVIHMCLYDSLTTYDFMIMCIYVIAEDSCYLVGILKSELFIS